MASTGCFAALFLLVPTMLNGQLDPGIDKPGEPFSYFSRPTDVIGVMDDIRAAGGLRAIRKTLPTSIVLEQDLVDKLREKGAKRGLGYQTMLKLIAREHVDEY